MPKPPHFFQTHPFSCVPACLRMVLASLGFEVSEFDLRNLCQCDETGVERKKAINAVLELGFDSYESTLTIDELRENLKINLSPIVFLRLSETANYSHAVVVYKISKEKVFVLDPEIGERELDINLFTEIWSRGLTIIIENKR